MVHIKRVELSHFKSFGGTTQIPLLSGFTVVSGPNGSGKSNILDALLFGLGLASSRGMRAERLPDLVNHKFTNNGRTAETSVSVTFDLSDDPSILLPVDVEIKEESLEWTVTRRLRVTKGGNYASNFYINGEPCTVAELHEKLNLLRIYPEGYNVVLQGDVTRIITMNSRERREIIDELAGVAEFDRKINQSKETLAAVKEREDHCRIIEQELIKSKERLAADSIKAEKYQKLKQKIQEKQQWELVLVWKALQQQASLLTREIEQGETKATELSSQLTILDTEINQTRQQVAELNTRVKALGEEEQLSLASQLATQKAKCHQLQQRQQELENSLKQIQLSSEKTSKDIEQYQHNLATITTERWQLETKIIPSLTQQRNQAQTILAESREKAHQLATASEAWVQEQTSLNHTIAHLQKQLNPQRTEQAQLQERFAQLQRKITEQTELSQAITTEINRKQEDATELSQQVNSQEEKIQSLGQQLAAAEAELFLQQETQARLIKEQREKQRQLDKLEATKQAQQEAQGTYATKVILQSNLLGVCGLVVQLGQVETPYQLALEIAAGARLGYLVVENDEIAAIGIQLLKQKRAGRATFLPLNKIQPPRLLDTRDLRYARGFVDLAVNLVECSSKYRHIFAYVFGSTVIFENLDDARSYLGKYRIVTLDGELLETSGAMTGGSKSANSTLHFGTAIPGESEEFQALKTRLTEITSILQHCDQNISHQSILVKNLNKELTEIRQQHREINLILQQLDKEINSLKQQKEQLSLQLANNQENLEKVESRLKFLLQEIPVLEQELQANQQRLAILEESYAHSEWQQMQALIKVQERELHSQEQSLYQGETKLKDWQNQAQRFQEKIIESEEKIAENQQQQLTVNSQISTLKSQLSEIEIQIEQTQAHLAELSAKLGKTKQERDVAEEKLKKLQNHQQNKQWELQKSQETQQERQLSLANLQAQIETQAAELPNPLPEIPLLIAKKDQTEENATISFDNFTTQLEQLQKEIRNAQKRLEAMEPVNMLALEEYERNQERLNELSEKLATLEAERTELLLRIENFTTLRFRAFKEAFDAVNQNFQGIFATLSEGDGYLQLEDRENIFNGGLNLVAHPKGKPVQRLSSMSGGEKSLTALSFIFALQRYRPSPFYAFDEVDMFLDGANVERLSKMIKQQAKQAQFIVVSLRRPMIEASERTIGVTQARGAYTQVLGIKL